MDTLAAHGERKTFLLQNVKQFRELADAIGEAARIWAGEIEANWKNRPAYASIIVAEYTRMTVIASYSTVLAFGQFDVDYVRS